MIETIERVSSIRTAKQLQDAIEKLVRGLSNGEIVYINPVNLALEEETLTDGSKVFNLSVSLVD